MKVLEKFRNKKVFIGYLVGVLLLSTSVSFAYFTSTTSTSGEGSVAVATTVDLFVEGLQAEGIIEFNNTDMYPGHIGIASIRVTGKGQDVPALYNLVFNGTNTFNTELKYTVYKTTTEIDASYSCDVRTQVIGVNTIYYEECSGNNIGELGEVVSSGTIHTGEGTTNLKESEILLTSLEGEEVYYYVVIEYPNLDASQNDDLGSTISGNITVEKLDYQFPEISMIGTTVSGSNGWVRSASVNTTITTQTGVYEALYCTTTESSCTPNTSATISDNSFSVSLSNNSSAQKVCVRVTDEYNQVREGCSETYNVDNQTPTSSTTIASSTTGSSGWYQALSINATGTDSHSGVASIKYCTTTSSTCTPTTEVSGSSTTITLSSNTSSQRVCAQAVDEAGNTSSITCSDAYNVDVTNPSGNVTIASSTAGSNNWYRALSLTVSGSDSHSGVSSMSYCTTTSSTCTPSTNVSGSTANVTLTSNARAQRVCYQVTDNSGRTSSTSCSSAYSVDTTNPTVSITRTSSTQDSISVTVSGSDSHSGIYQYRFSSNGGSSYTTVTSSSSTYTYTFNNLNAGTTYNIRVQAVDRSGRTSSTASRSVETAPSAAETILAGKTISTARSGAITGTLTTNTTGTVYSVQDDDGTSYVYAGAVDNNWISFAGYYWRIIRINGDGSIRMIYNGTTTDQTGTGTQITVDGTNTFRYNPTYRDNTYIGYMTGLENECASTTSCSGTSRTTSYSQATNNTYDSNIKSILDEWYQDNLASHSQYISTEAGFCNDRQPQSGVMSSTSYGTLGYGTNATAYAPLGRLMSNSVWKSSQTPSLRCTNTNDLFTVSGSSKGNHDLTYPIGLITSDEVVLAGGFGNATNNSYYLYTGRDYWTMSPYHVIASGNAYVFIVNSIGYLGGSNFVDTAYGVRPVINLKADVTISGSGTASNPYVVS